MIVVVDTNVWVSALHFESAGSVPAQALRRAVARGRLVMCDELYFEIVRILTAKFGWTPQRIEQQLKVFCVGEVTVSLTHTTHVCRDPKDDMLLECAALADADLLITGDDDLLTLRSYGRTRIVTPKEYLLVPR